MVSTELLRQHRFFGGLSPEQVRALAMITDERRVTRGEHVFESGQPATSLYFLHDGAIELLYEGDDPAEPGGKRRIHIGDVVPGDIFGVSALLDSSGLRATAAATRDSRVLRMEAPALRALCQVDLGLELALMRQMVRALDQRLSDTQTYLAASRA